METRKRGRWWLRVALALIVAAAWLGPRLFRDAVRGSRPDPYLEASERDSQDIESLDQATNDEGRFYTLGDAARVMLKQGGSDEAKTLAEELLALAPQFRQNWNYGNAIHDAHIVLGYVALSDGDVKGAAQHLLAAGGTPGSPQLNTFGPNMSLARKLLQHGESEVVLKYFELCRKFWEGKGHRLDAWKRVVKSGGVPDFGASLIH